MSGDLRQLLEEAVPEPSRRLDPAAVLRTARRRRRTRRTVAAVAATVLAAAGVGISLLMDREADRAQPALPVQVPAQVPLELSVLQRRVPVDHVGFFSYDPPVRTIDEDPLDSAQRRLVHPGQASLVLTTPDGTEYYLAESTDGSLCLTSLVEHGGSMGACLPRSTLLTTGFVMRHEDPTGREMEPRGVVVLVPDGYEQVTGSGASVAVRDNAALVSAEDGREPQRLTLTGPDVPTVVLQAPYCPSPFNDACSTHVEPSARVAEWRPAAPPGPQDTSLPLLVTERDCAGGQSSEGRVQEPVVEYRPDAVVITIRVDPLGGAQTCPGNPATPYLLQLSEPIGGRALLDGGQVPAATIAPPAP
ncbi:hypothetical protein CLV92_1218 [Kineococcus xinjiangensis]|uniref:Uncharacterized protein n=1 Tax=Kineococcus xinjiangensis TaxID=512762 RepID=A0A2S6ICC4_9ACTN|nr:hypothetical protein [Kineococcus xinjiangensis]PPK90878.1 hypothetical protein CLV92_1218 [Kineococcus xinjiangensis]